MSCNFFCRITFYEDQPDKSTIKSFCVFCSFYPRPNRKNQCKHPFQQIKSAFQIKEWRILKKKKKTKRQTIYHFMRPLFVCFFWLIKRTNRANKLNSFIKKRKTNHCLFKVTTEIKKKKKRKNCFLCFTIRIPDIIELSAWRQKFNINQCYHQKG